jgi:hypothetical protein
MTWYRNIQNKFIQASNPDEDTIADPQSIGYKQEFGEHHGPVAYKPDFWISQKGYHSPPMPLPKTLYHVTPYPHKILEEGFKTNLVDQTFGSGDRGGYSSFTSLENAKLYHHALKDVAKIAHEQLTWHDLDYFCQYYQISDSARSYLIDQAKRDVQTYTSSRNLESSSLQYLLLRFLVSSFFHKSTFPLFVDSNELLDRLKKVNVHDVAILKIETQPKRWTDNININPQEMKDKYTYLPTETEWRIYQPESIPKQTIQRIAKSIVRLA